MLTSTGAGTEAHAAELKMSMLPTASEPLGMLGSLHCKTGKRLTELPLIRLILNLILPSDNPVPKTSPEHKLFPTRSFRVKMSESMH